MFEIENMDRVGDLLNAVGAELGRLPQCLSLSDSDGVSYARSFPLSTLFDMAKKIMVQVDGVPCEILDKAPTEDPASHAHSVQVTERVDSVDGAVKLMNFVHEELKSGRCRSVNQALQIVKKDRKTIDRFKHIYYLNATAPEDLKELEAIWKRSHSKGGLAYLDKLCAPRVDWHRLLDISHNAGTVRIFGKTPFADMEPKTE